MSRERIDSPRSARHRPSALPDNGLAFGLVVVCRDLGLNPQAILMAACLTALHEQCEPPKGTANPTAYRKRKAARLLGKWKQARKVRA